MKTFCIAILALAVLIGINSGITRAEQVIDSSKDPDTLMVISGKSGDYKNDTLTLTGVPNVVYFSDRPGRVSGHVSVSDFEKAWLDKSNNFAQDPPNAVLSVLSEDEAPQNAVIELVKVEIDGDTLSFKIKILQGKLPEKFGPSSIFIDGFLGSIWNAGTGG